jgi:succinoglycan biosynthesis protein ExoL
MLQRGGGEVTVLGFHRQEQAPDDVGSVKPVNFGRTHNGPLKRLPMIAKTAARLGECRQAVYGSDIIIARTLEMLCLAAMARKRFEPSARLVFECLDIHRMMLRGDALATCLRSVEARLLKSCDLLVVSSPAFVSEYFARQHRKLPPVCLIENKPLAAEINGVRPSQTLAGPPWRIGWYGMIRCRKSLSILAKLCGEAPHLLEVEIRGRPSYDVFPDFEETITKNARISFLGSYDRRDLGALYSGVHFTWAVDYFEQEGNSNWLLPNRLYEGSLHNAVPIALAATETARWLKAKRIGVILDEPLDRSLRDFLNNVTMADLACLRSRIAEIPRKGLVCDDGECRNFVRHLAETTGASADLPIIIDCADAS